MLEPALVQRVAEAAVAKARPLSMNGYKIELTRTLVKRALTRAAGLPDPVEDVVAGR